MHDLTWLDINDPGYGTSQDGYYRCTCGATFAANADEFTDAYDHGRSEAVRSYLTSKEYAKELADTIDVTRKSYLAAYLRSPEFVTRLADALGQVWKGQQAMVFGGDATAHLTDADLAAAIATVMGSRHD